MTGEAEAATPPTRRRRRKEARPAEIVAAALACFLEQGFEVTKIDDVARRAGVAKGTVYLYFETKEALFRAVVADVAAIDLGDLVAAADRFEGPVGQVVPALLAQLAETVATSRAPAVARLILRESERFPDLARIWFEAIASPLLASLERLLARAQARGEVRPGDARLHVFSILGPMMAGMLFGNLATRLGLEGIDLARLARQHGETVLQGLALPPAAVPEARP